MIQTRWRLVIQAFMRSFVVEYITKAIKSALLCAKGCRRRIQHILFQRPMHSLVPAILLRPAWLNALVHDPELQHAQDSSPNPEAEGVSPTTIPKPRYCDRLIQK